MLQLLLLFIWFVCATEADRRRRELEEEEARQKEGDDFSKVLNLTFDISLKRKIENAESENWRSWNDKEKRKNCKSSKKRGLTLVFVVIFVFSFF
jgi:hypothetical protein